MCRCHTRSHGGANRSIASPPLDKLTSCYHFAPTPRKYQVVVAALVVVVLPGLWQAEVQRKYLQKGHHRIYYDLC